MNSLGFYLDPGLTTPLTTLRRVVASGGSWTGVIYLGSPTPGKQFMAADDPGVSPLLLSITDSSEEEGMAPSAIKLSLTEGGLADATPGDELDLGAVILSGSDNSTPVWIHVDGADLDDGRYQDLALTLGLNIEVPT